MDYYSAPPPPVPPSRSGFRRTPSRGRVTSWFVIAGLAITAATLVAVNNSGPQSASDTAATAQPTPPVMPSDNSIPVPPGTGDNGSAASPAPAGSAPAPDPSNQTGSLSDVAASLGEYDAATGTYEETRVYAGYTVSSGAVEASDEELQNRIRQLGGKLLANSTDNQGGPTVIHAELTFLLPQDDVIGFRQSFGGDYQTYGWQYANIDRSAQYQAAVAQQIIDKGDLVKLQAQRKGVTDPTDSATLDAQIQTLSDRITARQGAIDRANDAHNVGSFSRLTVLLDERHAAPATSFQAAWLLGTRNVSGIATGALFIGLTVSPLLVLLLPFWLFRRRISRRFRLAPVPVPAD